MTVSCNRLIILGVYCNASETGLARTVLRTVRLVFLVKHHVPESHSAAVTLQRAEEDGLEIIYQTIAEIIVPFSDGSFCEIYGLIRILADNLVKLRHVAAITVPCRTMGPL